MPEVMGRIKQELGPDAVILYTKKTTKNGIFKFLKKELVEAVAAVDGPDMSTHIGPTESPFAFELGKWEERLKTSDTQMQKAADENPFRHSKTPMSNDWSAPFPDAINNIHAELVAQGLTKSHADALAIALLKKWVVDEDQSKLKKHLFEIFQEAISASQFQAFDYQHQVLNLIGPTGVGKTTTAAKIASKAKLEDGKSIAFITTDTYRIAAVEQLKTYAKILDAPLKVAYTKEDFQAALTDFKNIDLIIVDSAGRNYQQSKFVEELKSLIPFTSSMACYLVLSAAAKTEDLMRVIQTFEALPIAAMVLTKFDETASIGSVFNILLDHAINIAYFTNGQNVPDDIIPADKEALIYQFIEGVCRG